MAADKAPITTIDGFPFTSAHLDRLLRETAAELPPGKRGAIIAAASNKGERLALEMANESGTWRAQAAYEHDHNGGQFAIGEVMYSW